MRRCLLPGFVLVAALGLAGCSASTTSTPPPTPQVLFVGNGYAVAAGNRAKIFYYGFPVTSTSTPGFTLVAGTATSALESFAQDALFDYVADCTGGTIRATLRPLTSASTQAFALTAAGVGPDGIAVDASGNLYAGENCGNNHIDVWSAPVTSASVVSVSVFDATVTTKLPQQMVIDNVNHLLYVANYSAQQVLQYSLPLTITSTAAVKLTIAGANVGRGVAIDSGTNQLFVSDGQLNKIYVFNLPISGSNTPALTITTSTTAQRFYNLAFDRAGNLYASEGVGSVISVFVPPFASSSNPAFSLAPTGIDSPWALNVGFP